MTDKNDNSPHILNTSSNLLGFCFIIITSLKVLKLSEATIIDELTSIALVFFMASSLLSFLAMRSPTKRGLKYEKIADAIFLGGLIFLFTTTMFFTLNIIK